MSVDPRRTSPFCEPRCYRECRCSRWPDYVNRFGHPVRPGDEPDWWDPDDEGLCVWAAYQPKGAASFAASLLDLSGNGNNAGDPGGVNTPAWDAVNGWKFDGAVMPNGDYLTTTFVAQNDQSQSIIVQFTNVVAKNAHLCGAADGGGISFGIRPNWAGVVRYENGQAVQVAPQLVAGNLGVAGNQGYRNGIAEGAAIANFLGVPVSPVYIGAQNNAGAVTATLAVYVQAVALYDCALTPAQVSSIATAMAAL